MNRQLREKALGALSLSAAPSLGPIGGRKRLLIMRGSPRASKRLDYPRASKARYRNCLFVEVGKRKAIASASVKG